MSNKAKAQELTTQAHADFKANRNTDALSKALAALALLTAEEPAPAPATPSVTPNPLAM